MSNDLIKRSDAIDAIELVDWYHQNRNKDMVHGANSDEHQAWYKAEDVYKVLEEVPSADRPQGWIPCSERLPSEKDYIGDVVIWCTDKSIVGVGWYYESTKSWATIDDTFPPILGEVIAWMPLPEPYREKY